MNVVYRATDSPVNLRQNRRYDGALLSMKFVCGHGLTSALKAIRMFIDNCGLRAHQKLRFFAHTRTILLAELRSKLSNTIICTLFFVGGFVSPRENFAMQANDNRTEDSRRDFVAAHYYLFTVIAASGLLARNPYDA